MKSLKQGSEEGERNNFGFILSRSYVDIRYHVWNSRATCPVSHVTLLINVLSDTLIALLIFYIICGLNWIL